MIRWREAISYLTKNHLRKKYPDEKIILVTSDHDLLQIIDENTVLVNLQNKELNPKSLFGIDYGKRIVEKKLPFLKAFCYK